MDLKDIKLHLDGVTRTFAEWTDDCVNKFYPDLGQRTYRVPALHFNQQKLVKNKAFGGLELHTPDKSHAKGDFAHTLVVETMEQLSNALEQKGEPLFIISALDYDNYLARVKAPPCQKGKEIRVKAQKAKKDLTAAKCDFDEFEKSQAKVDEAEKASTISLGKEHLVENHNEESQPPVVKSSAKKQDEKKKAQDEDVTELGSSVLGNKITTNNQQTPRNEGKELPPTPAQTVNCKGQRGDFDIILLHKHRGVILVEVKATGGPDFCNTDKQIYDRVRRAIQQVQSGRNVFHFIMPDLSCDPCVTLVVAFPHLTKERLNQVLSLSPSDPEILFLCKDDMINFSEVPSEHSTTSVAGRDHREEAAADQLAILAWWNSNLVTPRRGSPLSSGDMKTIVGRTCGLLSVVSVWTQTKPRVEIRTTGQAIGQVADRFSNIVLLPKQASLLAHPSPSFLVLTGPMGSGKTLMLQLKGRQWVQEGKRVVVLNVRAAGKGRPIGHALEEAIRKAESADNLSGSVERHDLATKELDLQDFHAELERVGPTDKLCFVLDELTHHTFFLLDDLRSTYPNCCIWCVAMFLRQPPVGFQHFNLGAVLRSPPSVQLLLKELDLHPFHRDAYSTRSAARGLPCDGPPIIFIQHKQHGMDTRPHDCIRCADKFVNVLQSKLGLVFPNQQETAPIQSGNLQKSGKSRAQPKAAQAKPLSFRDVILLVSVPIGYFKQESNGLWSLSKEGVTKFFEYVRSCPFITRLKECGVPLKIILDNTSLEVAFSTTDEILVADVFGFHGLERKVVLYLPGGPVLDSTPVETGSSDGSPVKSSTDFISHATETVSVKEPSCLEKSQVTEVTQTEDNTASQSKKIRMSTDLRGDSPFLMSALSHTPDRNPQDSSESVNQEFMIAPKPVDSVGAQSVFLVPDVEGEVGHRQSEVHCIREAIASLSMDDQDWLFVAAARCLSQLIVVIPSKHSRNN